MRRGLRDERGLVAIEFALLAPVLLLILLGIIQIGIYIFTTVDLRDATSEGARQLTVLRNDATGDADVKAKVVASVGGEVDTSKLTCTFSPDAPWAPGTAVTMTCTYPATLSVLGVSITSGPITTTAKVTVE